MKKLYYVIFIFFVFFVQEVFCHPNDTTFNTMNTNDSILTQLIEGKEIKADSKIYVIEKIIKEKKETRGGLIIFITNLSTNPTFLAFLGAFLIPFIIDKVKSKELNRNKILKAQYDNIDNLTKYIIGYIVDASFLKSTFLLALQKEYYPNNSPIDIIEDYNVKSKDAFKLIPIEIIKVCRFFKSEKNVVELNQIYSKIKAVNLKIITQIEFDQKLCKNQHTKNTVNQNVITLREDAKKNLDSLEDEFDSIRDKMLAVTQLLQVEIKA
jgi:hypothetical protein